MGRATRVHAPAMIGVLWLIIVLADEAPVSGNVKTVDPAVETTSQGKPREVTVRIEPTSRIVRFVRVGTGFEDKGCSSAR